MGTGYTRNDTDNNIADGNVINAADFDGEFDAIVSAFSTSGHTHDGTSAEGGPVTVLGPAQDFVVSATTITPKTTNTLDLGTDALEFKDIYIDGVAYIDGLGRNLLVAGTNQIQFLNSDINISSTADNTLTLASDGAINLTATTDVVVPANVGITFGTGEKIEGDSTDLTITSGAKINLTATSDVVIPASVGLILDGSGDEKIESDGTDISISVGSGGDINIPANIGVTFGDDGEKIEGNGTDLTINASNDLNLTATTDINIPANVGLTFGDDAEKIEGDGTDLTISGNNINLTAVADVNIPSGVGLTFATAEKIESDGTDLSITVGSGGDINIPADIGLTFGNDGEKIEGDGTDLTITGNNINLTATADVVLAANTGLVLDGSGNEKIESDGTDISISVGSGGDINIPANIGLTFGDDGEKIEGDGTNLAINSSGELDITATTVDINGALDVSSTYTGAGLMTTGGNIVIPDAGNIGSASDTDAIAIGADGDVTLTQDLELQHDGATIAFGANDEITITHVHNEGLAFKHTATTDDTPFILTLQSGEVDMDVDDVVGAIRFQTPDAETGVGDARLVVAAIQAVAEGSYSDTVNTTRLEFHTAVSEAASSKMTLSSAGLLTIADDFMIKDGGTIGVASTNDAITISSAGIVTFKDDIIIKDGGTIGSASDTDAIAIASDGVVTLTQKLIGTELDISGDIDVDGTTNLDVVDIDGATNIDLADGVADNAYALIVKNQEATDDRSYGLLVHAGSTSTDRALVINDHDGSNALFYVTGAGDVGIQTTAPKRHLHINGGSESVKLQITNSTTGSSSDGDGFQIGIATDGTANIEQRENADLKLFTNNTERLLLNASGDVIIRTADRYLYSNATSGGTTIDAGIRFESSTPRLEFWTNDTERLAIKADGTIMSVDGGTDNTRFGEDAGAALVSGANNNTLIGHDAGKLIASGDENVFVGSQAGDGTTDNSENTGVGYRALTDDIGDQNTALGAHAGDTVTGNRNVLLGYNVAQGAGAIDDNVVIGSGAASNATFTGNDNVFIGKDAGFDATSAHSNVLVGHDVGLELKQGTQNTAVGFQALVSEDDHGGNVAVGWSTLKNLNAGADGFCTAVGYNAGRNLNTGVNNTFIGSEAGAQVTSSTLNTFVGVGAGSGTSSTPLTSGSRNVALGVNAGNLFQGAAGENIAIGCFAGDAITTALHNVVIGDSAGSGLTTQGGNIAIGHNALNTGQSVDNVVIGNNAGLQLTADENVIIGVNAGDGATSITQCTIVGSNAASGATMTGDNNTLIGRLTGNALTSGSENTFLGAEAGDGTDDGANNTAVGFRALSANCSSGNTAVGMNAGIVITGQFNTCVGESAGDAITGGNSNICIGQDADVSSASNTNSICIGVGITAASDVVSIGKAGNVISNTFTGDLGWSYASDERLKKNITDQTLGLDFINDLRTVKYNWKPSNELDASDPQLKHLRREDEDGNIINDMNTTATMHNFVAQEVKAALDKAGVSSFGGWKEDHYGVQQVSREMFVIPLVKAVQELSTKLDAALARIKTLEES